MFEGKAFLSSQRRTSRVAPPVKTAFTASLSGDVEFFFIPIAND